MQRVKDESDVLRKEGEYVSGTEKEEEVSIPFAESGSGSRDLLVNRVNRLRDAEAIGWRTLTRSSKTRNAIS